MQEKCPICGKIISANENKCSECGFMELHKTFISKIDAEEWIENVVRPYKTKYEESNINNNIQTLQVYNGTYTGEVLNGKRHGYGKFISHSGLIYEGEYKNGLSDGKGKKIYTNGDVYEGEWKHGNKHGQGKMIYADGTIFEGEWENNRKILGTNKISSTTTVKREEIDKSFDNLDLKNSTLDEKTTRIIVIIIWAILTILGLCSLTSDGGGMLGAILLLGGFALLLYGPGKL